ncbi:hypothetical protein B0H19DRAFT_1081485 [Mycena capillaripes]|nr:hypothetical protein B0H19DRAFT_1081485 [Mycena capillaripes]
MGGGRFLSPPEIDLEHKYSWLKNVQRRIGLGWDFGARYNLNEIYTARLEKSTELCRRDGGNTNLQLFSLESASGTEISNEWGRIDSSTLDLDFQPSTSFVLGIQFRLDRLAIPYPTSHSATAFCKFVQHAIPTRAAVYNRLSQPGFVGGGDSPHKIHASGHSVAGLRGESEPSKWSAPETDNLGPAEQRDGYEDTVILAHSEVEARPKLGFDP